MTLTQLSLECEPPRTLGPRRELVDKHCLARAPEAGQRPVGVQRSLIDERLELGNQAMTASEVRRGNAVPGSERVGDLCILLCGIRVSHLATKPLSR